MRRETRSDASGEQHARREIVRPPARVHLALVVAAQVDHRLEPQRVERGQILVARPFMVCRAHQYRVARSEEHTSELQSQMRTSYAVSCLKKKYAIFS